LEDCIIDTSGEQPDEVIEIQAGSNFGEGQVNLAAKNAPSVKVNLLPT